MVEQNGNAYVRKWQLVASGLALAIAIGGGLFRAGAKDEQLEMKIAAVERHVDYDDLVLARKDVIEQRLLYIEEEEKKIETLQAQQNDEVRRFILEHRR